MAMQRSAHNMASKNDKIALKYCSNWIKYNQKVNPNYVQFPQTAVPLQVIAVANDIHNEKKNKATFLFINKRGSVMEQPSFSQVSLQLLYDSSNILLM